MMSAARARKPLRIGEVLEPARIASAETEDDHAGAKDGMISTTSLPDVVPGESGAQGGGGGQEREELAGGVPVRLR